MRIPHYWACVYYERRISRDVRLPCACWGWSDVSQDAARSHAQERIKQAQRNAEWRLSGASNNEYDLYLSTPLREPVSERIYCEDTEIAAITRNRYGSLVLNTAQVLFVDVDLPKPRRLGLWSLFSRKKRQQALLAQHETIVDRIMDWSQKFPEYSFRLYQTCAGYRLLFTDKCYAPDSHEVDVMFADLGADRLYQLLTKKQECFRARLSPKYWRLRRGASLHNPPCFDRSVSDSENWIERYESVAENYRVCSFIEAFGQPQSMLPEVAMVVDLHDRYTNCFNSALPLA